MHALVFQHIGQLSYERMPDPQLEADTDAIVQVHKTAVCGSDLHIYHGRETGLDAGTVMGHEFVGEIVACGSAVKQLRPGDRVASPFTTSCGQCFYCRRGLSCRCTQGQLYGWREGGAGLHGAQAEYVRVPLAESTLWKYPQDAEPELALLTGDILATAFYCADRAGLKPEGVYVVVGCGPVGLLTILAARERGAEQLFAIDAVPERLEKAAEFGAVPLNYQATDPKDHILAATSGRGADAVMEAVGSEAASRLAFSLLRPGGTLSVVGVHTSRQFAFSPTAAYDKNLTFCIGRCPARDYMETLYPLLHKLHTPLTSLITHHFPLSRGAEAYQLFDRKAGGCLKVILEPGGEAA
ncbi:MAG: alcohol dehydrogenase [Bacteroidetes bacterium]|nr:MAG: alcohol dehydrogenase [Bacteroidota bacterium]